METKHVTVNDRFMGRAATWQQIAELLSPDFPDIAHMLRRCRQYGSYRRRLGVTGVGSLYNWTAIETPERFKIVVTEVATDRMDKVS